MNNYPDFNRTRLPLYSFFIFLFLFHLGVPGTSQSLQEVDYLEPGYYAVVGVFGVHKNAINFTEHTTNLGENAKYALYPPRNLYYVQIGKYETYDKARVYALLARDKSGLDSTWVFKALPFTLADGTEVGKDVEMDKGVGVEYQMEQDTANITHVLPQSSAMVSGISEGDQITRIGGESVAGANLSKRDMDERLLGVGGSTLNLTILRDGKEKTYTLSRGEVKGMVDKGDISFDIENDTVIVRQINEGAPVQYLVLKEGDKILTMGGKPVSGVGMSSAEINETFPDEEEQLKVTILRDGVEQEYVISKDSNEMAGVGLEFIIRGDTAYITKVLKGSPAEAKGLAEGDKILAVNGLSMAGAGISRDQILEGLNGKDGSEVNLIIIRDGVEHAYTIERGFAFASVYIEWDISKRSIGINKFNVEESIKGVKMYFNTFRTNSFKEVPGKIEVVDADKLKRYGYKDSHKVVGIPMSINRSGNVQYLTEIFGYKKVQLDFNLNDPINEQTSPYLSYDDSILVVDFELHRYTVGDLVTMYNVYFFKDAAIMRPESKYEMQQLLEMLNENKDYSIEIRGHTNGNNSGPIIEMEAGSENYFSKSGNKTEGWGSAKKLSSKRAELIRAYLVSNGIRSSRIEAKGFGGKNSIYEKFDPLAYKNVRVEIKILSN